MKSLKETYVIVDVLTSLTSFFTDNVSFDRKILDEKAVEMNKEFNDSLKATFKKSKKKNATEPTAMSYVKFVVMSLSEAVDKFHDECAEMYIEHDESY